MRTKPTLIAATLVVTASFAAAPRFGAVSRADGSWSVARSGLPTWWSPVVAGQEQDVRAEVLATIRSLFDAMRAKDTVALRGVFHPEARLMSTSLREGRVVVNTTPVDAFVGAIGRARATLDERTADEEVRIDGPMATAWTPYAFFRDGSFSHCGVNSFQLARFDQGWRIIHLVDTRRTEACPEGAPRGVGPSSDDPDPGA